MNNIKTTDVTHSFTDLNSSSLLIKINKSVLYLIYVKTLKI